MQTNEARLSALALALALTGCWPKSHDALQSTDGGPGSPPGGPWSECFDAAVEGVSGDTCTFPEGARACMIPNPIPEPESPDGWGETIFWTAAACLSDRQLLIRSERWEFAPPGGECPPAAAHRSADGCIELRNCGHLDTYCVPNALLPLAVEGPLVELDSPESCVALRDNAEARPGSPCSGEQICAIGFRTAEREPGSAEPTLVWCHAERLRFSITYPGPFHYENVTSVIP